MVCFPLLFEENSTGFVVQQHGAKHEFTNSRVTVGVHGISDTLPYYKVTVTDIHLAIDWKKIGIYY